MAGYTDPDYEKTHADADVYNGDYGTNSYGYTHGAYSDADIKGTAAFGKRVRQADVQNHSGYGDTLSLASRYAQDGNFDADAQRAAMAQNYRIASGGQAPSTSLAYAAMLRGADSNMALASSSLGGSLGQVAAMRAAAQGQAGYLAQGQQQIAQLQAQEQAAAQQRYAAQSGQLLQGTNNQMGASLGAAAAYGSAAQTQADLYQQQRQLQDQADLFGQGLSQQESISNYQQQQDEANAYMQYVADQAQHDQARKNWLSQFIGSTVGGMTTALAHSGSDVRMKEPLSLGHAAEMQLWR